MSNSKRLKWLGPVRLDGFKACAKVLGRALGVPHNGSLEALARSCGWLSYWELNRHPDPRHGAGLPAKGSLEEIYDLWCKQVVISYGLRSPAELDAIEQLPKLFRYVLKRDVARPAQAPGPSQVEEGMPCVIHDPMLRASDWRDAEFRQWIRGVVDRTKPKARDDDALLGDSGLDEVKRLEEDRV